ncbi:hypothetical protein N9537_05050 [Porticoccaceae bacterium]|nr:hypothetical protein [Porticoccaceae bacterium]
MTKPNPKVTAPRLAYLLGNNSPHSGAPDGKPIVEFRHLPAWVLLGEPGAGKSETLRQECIETNGLFITITDFVHTEPDPDWKNKTLFLDGLDETRASGGENSTIQIIKQKLRQLNYPPFRIACRAADWLGSSDKEALQAASPDQTINTLQLELLQETDIIQLLQRNHGVDNPQNFINKAETLGLGTLLKNPQTLGLLSKAVSDNQWPATRDETFNLACEQLAKEENKPHRDNLRKHPTDVDALLNAAGQLCAVMLLADKSGIALDVAESSDQYPTLADCKPLDLEVATRALNTPLFMPAGEEKMIPSHRSIAEYLAARWLAKRIDSKGLPLSRLLNLLLAQDQGVVAGLRGLYGWLALHCLRARNALIDADPMAVIVYGDPAPMGVAYKRQLLNALYKKTENFRGFRWDDRAPHTYGALADPQLKPEFINILKSKKRDETTEAYALCVLDILSNGDPIEGLKEDLLKMVKDCSHWPAVRRNALNTLLKYNIESPDHLRLLNQISKQQVSDADDELTGALLHTLYPHALDTATLVNYLHHSKDCRLTGSYCWFWDYTLPTAVPDDDLPKLLNLLAEHPVTKTNESRDHTFKNMVGGLLSRALELHGDQTSNSGLFNWLGIYTDKYERIERSEEHQKRISTWLSERPDRYKGLLELIYQRCKDSKNIAYAISRLHYRLHDARAPTDIGLWHLEQAEKKQNKAVIEHHLEWAAYVLAFQKGAGGLTLDQFINWPEGNPERQSQLAPFLVCEIPAWQKAITEREKNTQQERTDDRQKWTKDVFANLDSIKQGTCDIGLLNLLAGVWKGNFSDIQGETPEDRFNDFCTHGSEALYAAESGFKHCPERDDLPTTKDIISLYAIEQRFHTIRPTCLIGMSLRYKDTEISIDSLSDYHLSQMIAFYLTEGINDAHDWFGYIASSRPELAAPVLTLYVHSCLKNDISFISTLKDILTNPKTKTLTTLVTPELLAKFPVRLASNQLRHLRVLLKTALRYMPEILPPLIAKKIQSKGMNLGQSVYWRASAALLDPAKYENLLWGFIGTESGRINHLYDFFESDSNETELDIALSPTGIGKLIEVLAPHAELDWKKGGGVVTVTPAMNRGDKLRSLILRLSQDTTAESVTAIDRLLNLQSLNKIHFQLEDARHQQSIRKRENEFQFLPIEKVTQVINNTEPANIEDLCALTLDLLDDIAVEIRQENDNEVRIFWNIEDRQPISQRHEDLCRNAILTTLRDRLRPKHIECQPEGYYARDKRADIRLSFHNELDLPIEIKKDSNRQLWTAIQDQLINQYSIAPKAQGYGIYLALWFGGKGMTLKGEKSGGKRPKSAKELLERLKLQIPASERHRIFVRVIDVSW